MSDAAAPVAQPPLIQTRFIRIFGWAFISTLASYMIVNVANLGWGAGGLMDMGVFAWITYFVLFVVFTGYVLRSDDQNLRGDAQLLHNVNLYLIRACFWSVMLVGIADATIAFMRTENLLDFLGQDAARAFGRARFVGMNVHLPIIAFSMVLALFTRTLGFTWLALLIVAAELLIVIARFVFSYEQALMGDLVRYWYAALFLFSSAYTLFEDGHVRVDVLYAGFKDRTRGFINAIGSIILGVSTCWVIIAVGFDGKSAIINSPVMNFEVTQTGSVGMYVKYQMAAFLGIFAITMLIQFISYFFEAVADYRGEPGKRELAPVSH